MVVVPGDQSTPKDLLPGGRNLQQSWHDRSALAHESAPWDAAADREKKEYPVLSCKLPGIYLHDAREYEAGAHDAASFHILHFESCHTYSNSRGCDLGLRQPALVRVSSFVWFVEPVLLSNRTAAITRGNEQTTAADATLM